MDCIFCKIVKGEIPCHKIYEDEDHLAFLDINPNTKGMSLLISKKHYDSYAFEMPDDAYKKLMQAAKNVAGLLDEKLETKKTAMTMEGTGVNHAHVKLYPLHGLEKKFDGFRAKEKIYFEKYEGYLSTQLGERADDKELAELAKRIRGE